MKDMKPNQGNPSTPALLHRATEIVALVATTGSRLYRRLAIGGLSSLLGLMTLSTALFLLFAIAGLSAEPAKAKIGVYDSRAVAYAWFCTPEHKQELNDLVKQAKAAKEAGKTEEFKWFETRIKEGQQKIHEQGFSTAPATEAMEALKHRLPEIQREAGVSQLISKWDKEALKPYRNAEQIDVTERLVQEFKPGEKQQKVIKELLSKPPVPLEELRKMKDI